MNNELLTHNFLLFLFLFLNKCVCGTFIFCFVNLNECFELLLRWIFVVIDFIIRFYFGEFKLYIIFLRFECGDHSWRLVAISDQVVIIIQKLLAQDVRNKNINKEIVKAQIRKCCGIFFIFSWQFLVERKDVRFVSMLTF